MGEQYPMPPKASRHCRHYSYERGKTYFDGGPRCAIGVDLADPGSTAKCMPDAAAKCPSRQEYTDAEREAWEAACSASLERLGKAVQALPKAIPLRSSGTIECPNCGGRLSYARWHRGAEIGCETPNCCGAHFSIAAGKDWPSHA